MSFDKSNVFNSCTSLKEVDFGSINITHLKMVFLDEMNFNQLQWCKQNKLISEIKTETAKQLKMCAFYATIPIEKISEFNAL